VLRFAQRIIGGSTPTFLNQLRQRVESDASHFYFWDVASGTLPLPFAAVVESTISPSHHKHHPSASIIAASVAIVETSPRLVPALLQSLMQSTALTVESQPGLVTAGTSQSIQFPVTSLVCILADLELGTARPCY